ncbi:tripartite motif-containing protein 40 [Carlito syrichta]|uniref:E3 ubiquitin ligase TRIM40 n=1 Tax=Carlito syrichta TaxID=1868482 RepID=A0A1U7UVA7_CARSF|nr:tripartite motif-containing protein 40 [Carlito syrichta]
MVPLHKDSQEEGICPICQERLKEAVSTDCRHLFCRVCLTQHIEKSSASGALWCPLCRKPCSEGVLGTGYICPRHQKKVCRYCEETRLLLCVECLASPEHKSHRELTIENAISHYKERLNRRIRKLRKDIGELQQLKAQEEEKLQDLQFQVDHGNHRLEAELESQYQTRGQLDALPQQWLNLPEDMPREAARILDITREVMQLSSLVTDLERTAKNLDTNTLKNASDLLNRSAPQKLEVVYSKLEKRVNESLQASATALSCSPPGHLISDSPQRPLSRSSNLSSLPLGLPSASPGLLHPEHGPISSKLQLSPDT